MKSMKKICPSRISRCNNLICLQWHYASPNPAGKCCCNYLQNVGATTYKNILQLPTKRSCKKHTKRKWHKIDYNAFDIYQTLLANSNAEILVPSETFYLIRTNQKVNYNIDELTFIGLYNNEGAKFNLDNRSSGTREMIFKRLFKRDSCFYRKNSIFSSNPLQWEEVSSYSEGGFFKGKVISEYDLHFSTEIYQKIDIYDLTELAIVVGTVSVGLILFMEITPVIISNLTVLQYYISNYGIRNGIQYYYWLGSAGLSDGVITLLQADLADGDSTIDDLAVYVVTDLSDGDTIFDDVVYYINQDASDGDTVLDDVVLGTYNNLRKVYKGTGIECHHLVEKRLIYVFKDCSPSLTEGQFLSTPLNKQAHQVFTNLWRRYLPYGTAYELDQVISTAKKVYEDYPSLLEAVNNWLKSIGAMQ